MEKPKILITNDDGIRAKGLRVLRDAFSEHAECLIIAPDTQCSAAGHGITLKKNITVDEFYEDGKFFGYSVAGTPADCVKLGIREILGSKPDLVVSGINLGSNTGVSVFYSGTVAAAREGTLNDLGAVAVSLAVRPVFVEDERAVTGAADGHDYTYAAEFTAELVKLYLKGKIPREVMLNVNVPDIPAEEIRGAKITRQAPSKFDEAFEKRGAGKGRFQYVLRGEMILTKEEGTSDLEALREKYVSVTPLTLDLTDNERYGSVKNVLDELEK